MDVTFPRRYPGLLLPRGLDGTSWKETIRLHIHPPSIESVHHRSRQSSNPPPNPRGPKIFPSTSIFSPRRFEVELSSATLGRRQKRKSRVMDRNARGSATLSYLPRTPAPNVVRFPSDGGSVPNRRTNGAETHPRPSITCATLAIRFGAAWPTGRTSRSVPRSLARGPETPPSRATSSPPFFQRPQRIPRHHVILPSRTIPSSPHRSN